MKSLFVMTGLLFLGVASVGSAASFQCLDSKSGYELRVSLPGHLGMGETHGTAGLLLDNQTMATLTCTYTSGITVTLDCKNSDYQVSGAANLSTLRLFYQGQQIGTLSCN